MTTLYVYKRTSYDDRQFYFYLCMLIVKFPDGADSYLAKDNESYRYKLWEHADADCMSAREFLPKGGFVTFLK